MLKNKPRNVGDENQVQVARLHKDSKKIYKTISSQKVFVFFRVAYSHFAVCSSDPRDNLTSNGETHDATVLRQMHAVATYYNRRKVQYGLRITAQVAINYANSQIYLAQEISCKFSLVYDALVRKRQPSRRV